MPSPLSFWLYQGVFMSNEQIQWLMKVLQPEKTLGSLPGIATLTEAASKRC
jgi:hypothetical protein